jgi:hypothetical protein
MSDIIRLFSGDSNKVILWRFSGQKSRFKFSPLLPWVFLSFLMRKKQDLGGSAALNPQ